MIGNTLTWLWLTQLMQPNNSKYRVCVYFFILNYFIYRCEFFCIITYIYNNNNKTANRANNLIMQESYFLCKLDFKIALFHVTVFCVCCCFSYSRIVIIYFIIMILLQLYCECLINIGIVFVWCEGTKKMAYSEQQEPL